MTTTFANPPPPETQPGDTIEPSVKRLAWEIEMRETHRKDRPWVKGNWGASAKTREDAIRNLNLAREMNRDSPYKPEFRLLELLTTVIEVKP